MKKREINWKKVIGIILLITLILSIAYTIARIIISPSEAVKTDAYVKVKSDYVLILVQCILGLVVMMIPSMIEHRWNIDIPNNMEIAYFIFLFCAIYLGEVRDFYYVIPYWDTILHAFSGAALGALGFSLVSFLNDVEQLRFNLNPFFISLFAFCFALTMGVIWEIYEFTIDGLFSLNAQKFKLFDGTLLVGRDALLDTMKDIIVDAISALVVSVIGYYSIKKQIEKHSGSN